MSQRTRILIALAVLLVAAAVVLGIDALQRAAGSPAQVAAGEPTLAPGSIPIYLDGKLAGSFAPDDLGQLQKVSFVEPVENKEQNGWLLSDVILLHVSADQLKPDSIITVSSSSRDKSAQVTWAEASDPANLVMFDLSNRGTLKLVSKTLPQLSTRDQWVQDTDKIEITSP
jgi:hypothetical protein